MNDKALEYLNRVITEHPGTPWAYLAKVELRDPLGWEWVEAHTAVAAMGEGALPPAVRSLPLKKKRVVNRNASVSRRKRQPP